MDEHPSCSLGVLGGGGDSGKDGLFFLFCSSDFHSFEWIVPANPEQGGRSPAPLRLITFWEGLAGRVCPPLPVVFFELILLGAVCD